MNEVVGKDGRGGFLRVQCVKTVALFMGLLLLQSPVPALENFRSLSELDNYTPKTIYRVQIGSFETLARAEARADHYRETGWGPVEAISSHDGQRWSVRLGHLATKAEAYLRREQLRRSGVAPGAFLVEEPNPGGWFTSQWDSPTTPVLSPPRAGFVAPEVLSEDPRRQEVAERFLLGEDAAALLTPRIADLPSTDPLRAHWTVQLVAEQDRLEKEIAPYLPWLERVIRGGDAATRSDWLEACELEAIILHEHVKDRWLDSFERYLLLAELAGDVPDLATRARVELVGLSRELAMSAKGCLEESGYFIRLLRENVPRSDMKAHATGDVIWIENMGNIAMFYSKRKVTQTLLEEGIPALFEQFYEKYRIPANCPREWAFCVAAHAILLRERENRVPSDTREAALRLRELFIDPVFADVNMRWGTKVKLVRRGCYKLYYDLAIRTDDPVLIEEAKRIGRENEWLEEGSAMFPRVVPVGVY